jgi:hypothetical protein
MPPKKGFSGVDVHVEVRWRGNCASASRQLTRQNITAINFHLCIFSLLNRPFTLQANEAHVLRMPAERTFSEASDTPRAMGMRAALEVNARSPLRPHHGERAVTRRLPEHYNIGTLKQLAAYRTRNYPSIAPGAAEQDMLGFIG